MKKINKKNLLSSIINMKSILSKLKADLFTDAMTGWTCQMWSTPSRVLSPPCRQTDWLADWGSHNLHFHLTKSPTRAFTQNSSLCSLTSTSYRRHEVQGQTKRWRRRNRGEDEWDMARTNTGGWKNMFWHIFLSQCVANSLKAWHPLSNYQHSLKPKVTFMLKYMAVSLKYIMSPGQNRIQYNFIVMIHLLYKQSYWKQNSFL